MTLQIGNPSAVASAAQIAALQSDLGIERCLLDSMAKYAIGGSGAFANNTDYEALSVAIPDGFLLNYGACIEVKDVWHFTSSTNAKTLKVLIGINLATAQVVWQKVRSTPGQAQEAGLTEIKRSTLSPAGLMFFGNNGIATYSALPGSTTTDPVSTNTIDPATTGLRVFFVAQLAAAASETITLVRAMVKLRVGEAT